MPQFRWDHNTDYNIAKHAKDEDIANAIFKGL